MRVIIPAAGSATRFGGVRKELVQFTEAPSDTPLMRAVARGLELGRVTVVTSVANAAQHARALADLPVDLRVRSTGADDLWHSILAGLDEDDGALLLADTVWDGYIPRQLDAAIVFGVFQTDEPERFSTLRAGRIVTKQPSLRREAAWGCVLWRREAAALWRRERFDTYDAAFQAAMGLGYATFPIAGYNDLGTFAAYRRWMVQL